MFTILRKDFGGRKGDRYFNSWENAEKEMLADIEVCCRDLNGKVIKKWDYFNSSKGFYVFEQEALFDNGEICHWALIDGYFEDN